MRDRALAAEVRHRHDRAAAARLHQRLGRARARDERVRAHVERHPEAVARRVREAALEILGRRERDRVHEQVEPAVERLADLARRRARRRRPSGRRTRSRAGCDTDSASSRTLFSIRSPWYVNASSRAAVGEPLARSPRRSTACSRRREPNRACLRSFRSRRTSINPLRLDCGLLAPSCRPSRCLRGGARVGRSGWRRALVRIKPHVRRRHRAARPHGHAHDPARPGVRPRPRDRRPAAAAARGGLRPRPLRRGPTRRLDVAVDELAALSAPDRRTRSESLPRSSCSAIPQARIGRRYQVVLDGFDGLAARDEAAGARPSRLRRGRSTRASAITSPPSTSPSVIGADELHDADRREGRRDQDRRSSTTASTARTRS